MKATVVGSAVVITSNVKLEDIKTVKKYDPDKLVLMGGEENKEPVFAFGITDGPGKVNKFGMEFSATPNAEGKAIVTLMLPAEGIEPGQIKEYIADKIGAQLVLAGKLERQVPDALAAINAERAAVMETITIA